MSILVDRKRYKGLCLFYLSGVFSVCVSLNHRTLILVLPGPSSFKKDDLAFLEVNMILAPHLSLADLLERMEGI